MLAVNNKNDTHRLFLEHNVFIVWKPEYNIGIPIIDEHHRGIVSIINSLYFGIQNHSDSDILNPIITMMRDYTRIHFKIEEGFQKMIDFPNAKRHHELHLELSSKLADIGRNSILDHDSRQVMEFLKKWWINHICCEDMTLREHLFKKK